MADDLRRYCEPPIVTVFGAGITGLTVAHELIERGFTVHVIEPQESPTEEYTCEVGGMAANQLGRVPTIDLQDAQLISRRSSVASRRRTLPPEDSAEVKEIVKKFIAPALARLQMEPVQRRFAITEHITFEKSKTDLDDWIKDLPSWGGWSGPPEGEWRKISDEHEITNSAKLTSVLNKILGMYTEYKNELGRILDTAFSDPAVCGASKDLKNRVKASLEPYLCLVRIVGYTDTDGLPEFNRDISELWAQWVGDALVELNENRMPGDRIPNLGRLLVPLGAGTDKPLGRQTRGADRARSNRVEFSIIGQTIGGEHGYRFFPSFYRHVFDTMKRTPIFNEQGEITPETAFDQLVSTPDSAVGFSSNRGIVPVKLRRFTSIKDLEETIKFFREKANFTPRDLLRLQTHLLKYMTSCKERRGKESEDVSFWQYIHADKVSYSPSAARFVDSAPQALVAMSARETDARTQYNSVIQMLVQSPLEPFVPDLTLNGTTSEAWLYRWKDYLKRRGVRFYIGSLERLELEKTADGQEELVPIVGGPEIYSNRPLPELDVIRKQKLDVIRKPKIESETEGKRLEFNFKKSDFFVMALPFEKMSTITWNAYLEAKKTRQDQNFCGPFRQIIEFDKISGRRLSDGTEIPRYRDAHSGLPINKNDPLRDISGVQYFLANNYRFIDGHVYYPDSPWALTSISQYSYYRDRVDLTGEYIGQQSFDIGDWYEIDPADNGTTAWNSNRRELAERTWNQATQTLESGYVQSLIKPKYYHLDYGIKFCWGPELDKKQNCIRTMAAFRGNAVVRIMEAVPGKEYKLFLSANDNKERTEIGVVAKVGDSKKDICTALCKAINATKSVAAATLNGENEIVVSPIITANDVVRIKATRQSVNTVVLIVDGTEFPLDESADKTVQNIGSDHVLKRGEDGIITVEPIEPPDRHSRFVSIAVCNADDCVQLLGGPRLTLELCAPVENRTSLAEIPRRALQQAVVLTNENPYIINVPRQWRHRPGLNHATGEVDYTIEKEVFRDSLLRRWVPAGTFMATYTRLTTMEAANESGRHAVNAILRALMALPGEEEEKLLFNGQGKLFGDPCKIWDPEDNELADLHGLKELDQALMNEDLPHILDIFRVIEFLENLPEDVSSEEAGDQVRALIEKSARESFIGLKALDAGVRSYLDAIVSLLSGR